MSTVVEELLGQMVCQNAEILKKLEALIAEVKKENRLLDTADNALLEATKHLSHIEMNTGAEW